MKKSPAKKNKKGMNIDDLAVMVQRGFAETATKRELNELRDEIRNNYVTKAELKLEIKNLKDDIEVMISKYIGTFRKDFDELANRVRKLEEKVFTNR